MDLWDLRDLCISATAEQWHVISSGPTYLNSFGTAHDHEHGHQLSQTEHTQRASYIPDVRVGIAWGLDPAEMWPGERTTYDAEWVKFADKSALVKLADLLYCGAVVDRVEFLVVDGSRAYLPLPDANHAVSRFEHGFVQLLDQIAGHNRFDEYFERSSMRIEG